MPRKEVDHFLEHGFIEQAVSNADTAQIEIVASITDAVGGAAFPKAPGTSSTNGMYLVDQIAMAFANTLLSKALDANHYDGDELCAESYRLADQQLKARRYHYDKIHKEVTGE